jgi:hypothetical protein
MGLWHDALTIKIGKPCDKLNKAKATKGQR